MDRKAKLLQGIDVASSLGAEIGALCSPFITRDEGRVIYVDHADTKELRRKYSVDPDVILERIVDVDAVWGSNTLAEVIGTHVDYVVASHVVEHVPDLITWLEEIHSVLVPNGEVRLIVPDKRFTFDYLRAETKLADVLYARLIHARWPHPQVVLDYVLNVVKLNGALAWRGQVDERTLERHHTLQHAMAVAQQAVDGIYHDVHCWVFTPRSFALLFAELSDHRLINFGCSGFHDTVPDTIEFFVHLRATKDHDAAAASWRAMADRVI